jgi:hypothetical protein
MYNISPQPNNYIATAPPMDEFQEVHIRYPPPIQTQYAYTTPTTQYAYPYAPPPSPVPFNYIQNVEQYRHNEIDERQRQQHKECCCLAILATLCCCFINTEL